MRRNWQRWLDNEAKQATAFRVDWAPNAQRIGVLILCSHCNETWMLRDAANRAEYSGNPVPMTPTEVAALEVPECGACGRSVLELVPMNPETAQRVEDAQRAQEKDYWDLNDATRDELDEHRGSRW